LIVITADNSYNLNGEKNIMSNNKEDNLKFIKNYIKKEDEE